MPPFHIANYFQPSPDNGEKYYLTAAAASFFC